MGGYLSALQPLKGGSPAAPREGCDALLLPLRRPRHFGGRTGSRVFSRTLSGFLVPFSIPSSFLNVFITLLY